MPGHARVHGVVHVEDLVPAEGELRGRRAAVAGRVREAREGRADVEGVGLVWDGVVHCGENISFVKQEQTMFDDLRRGFTEGAL